MLFTESPTHWTKRSNLYSPRKKRLLINVNLYSKIHKTNTFVANVVKVFNYFHKEFSFDFY